MNAMWANLEEGLPGRLNLKKALVVVAAQEDGPRIGRIRIVINTSTTIWTSSHSVSIGGDPKAEESSFYRLAQQAVAVGPVPYDQIVHPKSGKAKAKPQSVGAT